MLHVKITILTIIYCNLICELYVGFIAIITKLICLMQRNMSLYKTRLWAAARRQSTVNYVVMENKRQEAGTRVAACGQQWGHYRHIDLE